MKVLVFVKATPTSETGVMPTEQDFKAMGAFNDQLVKAGIIQDADGLKPSKFGKRVNFSADGKVSVTDGPFAESKELVAGYWIWNVKSVDEALSWARKCPNPMPGEEGVLEIRPVYAMEDFGEMLTPEVKADWQKMSKELARQKKPAKAKKSAKRAQVPKKKARQASRKK